jgi:small-conductance mechanosensitive channel
MERMFIEGINHAFRNLAEMVAEFLPRLVAMAAIILVGLLVAFLLKIGIRAILRLVRFHRLTEHSGAAQMLSQAQLPSPTELLSRFIFWIVWLCFVLIGLSVLNIAGLQEEIAKFFALLPQLFVAILILLVGLAAANFFSRAALLGAVNANLPSPQLWSGAVRYVIVLLAVSMALEQIGLGRETVLVAFSILFGSAMLALAIAFGLGGRDFARQVLERRLARPSKEREKEDELSPI